MKKITKTKEELLQELNALKQENASLKALYEVNLTEGSRVKSDLAGSENKVWSQTNLTGKSIIQHDEQNLRQLFDDYVRMYATRDDKLTTYFSENFSGFTGGGDFLVKDRAEWVAITRQDFAQIREPLRIELKDVAIQPLNDTTVVTTGFFTIHLPNIDHDLSQRTARLVLIFCKESAGWKISHSSISIPYGIVHEGEVYPLKELVDRNRMLEEQVAERTAQLSEANKNLKKTNEELARKIVEHQAAEDALLKSKQQYDDLVSKIPVGIYLMRSTPEGKLSLDYVSTRAAKIFNTSVENLLADSRTAFQAVHPDDKAELNRLNQEGILHLLPFDWKGRFLVDGKVKWLHLTSSPEPLENGEVLWHGLVVDITERKQAELIIQQQYDQLKELNSAKDKLFSIIAHDLKSPFQSLLGSSELLATEIESLSRENATLFSKGLNDSLKSLYALLENLLNWSMMQRNLIEYKPVSFNLFDVVNKIVEISNQSALKKNIPISNNVDTGIFVYADVDMLRSVIHNLIANAIKFTQTNGYIIISSAEKDGFIEVSVRDNGMGINSERCSKLFNFSTLFTTNGTAGEKGTGLGLSLCKEFIERNGGKIWVESEPGKGSKFTFTLPETYIKTD